MNEINNLNPSQKRIRSQEIILNKRAIRMGRSLGRIKGLWQENLSEMETSLKLQKETLKRVSKNYFNAMNEIEKEMNEVLEGPSVPNLKLDRVKRNSNYLKALGQLSSDSNKNRKGSEEESVSNRSAFSILTEDIASLRSYTSRQYANKTTAERSSAENELSQKSVIKEDSSRVQFENITNGLGHKKQSKSSLEHLSKSNTSKINPENSEKSIRTKAKDETENTQVNYEEIKNALLILKKANLINNCGNQELLKIAEMIKDPENSSNVDLMIQLINIENKKHTNSSSNSSSSRIISKPLLPSSINRLSREQSIDNEGTLREKYKFLEEKSLNRTMLSNENLLSPRNYDFLDNSLKFLQKNEELTDVKLEDLLNISSVFDNLGLLSAENTIIQEINKEPSQTNNEISDIQSIKKLFTEDLSSKFIHDIKRS